MREHFVRFGECLDSMGQEYSLIEGRDSDLFDMEDDDLLLVVANPWNSLQLFLYYSCTERMELHFGSWIEVVEGAGADTFEYMASLVLGILSGRLQAFSFTSSALTCAGLIEVPGSRIVSIGIADEENDDSSLTVSDFIQTLNGQEVHLERTSWQGEEDEMQESDALCKPDPLL